MQISETGFFRWVWRFNALAIAIAAILLSLVAAFAAWQQWRFHAQRNVSNALNIEEGAQAPVEDFIEIDGLRQLEGTTLLALTANRVQRGTGSSVIYKDSENNLANVYIFDRAILQGRWLMADNKSLLLHQDWLYNVPLNPRDRAIGDRQDRRVIGGVFQVVSTDSNGDGFLSARDDLGILLFSVQGATPLVILPKAEKVRNMSQTANDELSVLYELAGQTILEVFALPAGTSKFKTAIPVPKP